MDRKELHSLALEQVEELFHDTRKRGSDLFIELEQVKKGDLEWEKFRSGKAVDSYINSCDNMLLALQNLTTLDDGPDDEVLDLRELALLD